MLESPKTGAKARSRRAVQPERPAPRLNPAMPCDTAFRIVARQHLARLSEQHDGACTGDPEALHQMRIALTHLRTSIVFFSPMVADPLYPQIREELKWLNRETGEVRDLDVAIARITASNPVHPQAIPGLQTWLKKRAEGHRRLARLLRSARYRRLMEQTLAWVESGPWCTKRSKQAAKERARPIADYGASKLGQWEQKLLRKSRRLVRLDARKRHRLRLLNKKLTYSIESLKELFEDKEFAKQKVALKHLRKAQRSLGQLNDNARGQALAAALRRDGVETPLQFFGAKREKNLLQATQSAYRKLAKLKPFRN